MIDVLELPFDQYQRYRLAADLLEEVRPAGTSWRILDVGGRTALLRAFLPADRVDLVDLEGSDEGGLVLGDGSRLPFASASYDVVTAFDTLEHVPPDRREAFVAECRRVARRYVAVVGPCQAPAVEEAELLLQRFLKDKLGVEHRYLEEHRHHGLPDRARVEAQLAASGAATRSFGHGNLERWLALLCLSMYLDYNRELRGVAKRFFRFYNRHLYPSDHRPPVYRHAVVGALGGAPLPAGRGLASTGTAPEGAVARVTELAFEVAEFERASQSLHEERTALLGMIHWLQGEVAGHERSLSDARELQARTEKDAAAVVKEREELARQLEACGNSLRENDAKITELRAALHGRWKNLKRALGPSRPIP